MAGLRATGKAARRKIERLLRWRVAAPMARGLERAINVTVFSRSRWIRWLTVPLRAARRPCLLVRSGLDLSASLVSGLDEGGAPRRILYAGEREAREWVLQRLLPAGREELETFRVRPWNLRRLVEQRHAEVDLFVLELSHLLSPVHPDIPILAFPRWVRLWIPLEGGLEAVEARFGRNTRRQIRAVRSEGFEYRVVPGVSVFDEFHERHHLPFVHARHGKLVILHERRELEGFARRGTILQVLDRGRWVAGMLNVVVGRDVRCVVLGVLDGDPALIQRNVLKALYYFTILWAVERGAHSIDLGRARPVEDDPVLRQKRRWGARVESDPWEESRFLIAPGTNPAFFDAVRSRDAFVVEL